jgi:hypothetical protein
MIFYTLPDLQHGLDKKAEDLREHPPARRAYRFQIDYGFFSSAIHRA